MRRLPVTCCAALALLVPSTASAATLKVGPGQDGQDVVLYRAAAGEVNATAMRSGVGAPVPLLPFFEFAAPITVGPGCALGSPFVCGSPSHAYDAEVRLGDRDDVANVNSFSSSVKVWGGNGDDDALSGGLSAWAYGGDGDDTLRLAANDAARGFGGSGADRIAGGLGASFEDLEGDGGDDLLVPGGSTNIAAGGDGDDALVSLRGGSVTESGDRGDDVLVIAAHASGTRTLDGGRGDDVVDSSATGGVTVQAGPGDDRIDVAGAAEELAPDDVTCGLGFDVVWADPEDTLAADCELRLPGPAPELPGVAAAIADAQALRSHTPDPSAQASAPLAAAARTWRRGAARH